LKPTFGVISKHEQTAPPAKLDNKEPVLELF